MSAKISKTRSLKPIWKPHKYQVRTVTRCITNMFQAVFLDPGLGKTTIMLCLFKILRSVGKTKGALVIAPLRPCFLVWPKEAKKWGNFSHLKVRVMHAEGACGKTLRPKADLYVINPAGLKWLVSRLEKLPREKWPFDMLIVDESTKFKNMSAGCWKSLNLLVPKFKRRYILSGTPTPNSLTDIQGQMAIVDRGESFGLVKSYFYAKYFNRFGKPPFFVYKIASKIHEERLYRKASKYITRISAKEAKLDLPERVDNHIPIPLPRKARKYYEEVESEYFTIIEGEDLNADTEMAQRLKLQQIANGRVYPDLDPLVSTHEQTRVALKVHEAKLDALQDLQEELGFKPILIGYRYKHDLEAMQERFKDQLVTLSGASMKACEDIANRWNAGKISLLACYPGSAALGLNLQDCGQDVFWYSLIDNWEDYHQFILRIERQGSNKTFVRNHLPLAVNTIDEVIFSSLSRKHKGQFKFLSRVKEYREKKLSRLIL